MHACDTALAAHAVTSFFTARIDFLECNVKMGMDLRSAQYNQLSQRTSQQMVRQFTAVRALDARDGLKLMNLVQNSPMLPEHVTAVRDVVNGKVMEGDVGDAAGETDESQDVAKKQTHDYFEEYMFEEQWAICGNVDPALQSLAATCRAIGLWYPNEKNIAKIAAIAVGPGADLGNVKMYLNYVQTFKKYS